MGFGYKVLATEGFLHPVSAVNLFSESFNKASRIHISLKSGFLGKSVEYIKDDLELVEVINKEEKVTDASDRIKNGAIGIVLLGPVGILGAALGSNKTLVTIRVVTKNKEKLILEMSTKECEEFFLKLMNIDLKEEIKQRLLDNSAK